MQVFISWSGPTSRELGEALRQWIPSVLQSIQPYFTPNDIDKGTRWQSDIATKLEQSKVGILCLTRESLNKPWLMFEAGALSKTISDSKVCPILFGIEPTDLDGPLVHFQATEFVKPEIKKLMETLNKECLEHDGTSLADEVFDKVFEKWWPDLEKDIGQILAESGDNLDGGEDQEIRSDREIMEEVLSLNRRIASEQGRDREGPVPAGFLRDLFQEYEDAVRSTRTGAPHDQILASLQSMHPAMGYLIDKVLKHDKRAQRYGHKLARLSFGPLVPPSAPEVDDEIPF